MKKIWLVSFLILAPTLRAFPPSPVERILSSGQDQPAWPSQYGIDFWREGEGLTQSRIRSILQTRDGYLWLATDNGLVRFNGTSFTAFTIQTDSLEDNEVRALIEDNEGGLWIGTVGGLTLFKDGRFKTFRVSDGLPSDMISKLEKDLEGNIWMATAGGVIRFSQGRFTTFTTRQGLSHNFVRAVAAGPAGVFAANATSLHRYENGRFVALGGVVKSSDGRINDLLCSREGSVWISCENGVIKKLKDGSLVTFSKKGDLGSGTNYLYEDRQGTLWVASPRGLLRLQADRFAAVPFDSAKRLGVVYSVCADREGSLWIGLESGGLARLRVNRVRTLAGEDGLASDSTRSVFEDSRGAIWVGTVTGFAELSEGRVSNYTTIEGVPIGPVKSFAEDGSGGVWIGARQSVLIMEHGRLHRLAGWPLTVEIRVIYRDARNRMWIGTDGDGLFCVDNGRITHLGPRDGLPGGQIRAVHLDRRGVLWVATAGGGVVRYESGHFKSYGIADGLAGDRVLDIHEDDEGALWFATRGGLTRFKNNKFFSYGARNGLLESFVYAILDDDLGNFWFSSASGIFRVSKAELRDFANGRIKEVRSTDYGERDGMNTRACNAGNWPVAWKTADGRLLFCSMKGIVIVTPGHLFRNTIAPPVLIEGVTINEKTQSVGRVADVPVGSGEVEIHYAALSYLAPERVRFKYRLEGFNQDWVDARGRRFAYYASLPAGSYRFRVMACNNDGVWNKTPAEFSFVLQPPFYQTRLFAVLVLSAVGLIGWAAYQVRLYEIKKRYSAVLAERNRIACEIHDTLAQNLAGIALQLDSVMMQSGDVPPALRQHLDQACDLTRYSLAGARDAVMDLRGHDLERQELAVVLPNIASRLAANSSANIRVDVQGTPRRLDPVTEKNLIRIFQEAVGNAVKHAGASVIDIRLHYDKDSMTLEIRDDGCGFLTEKNTALYTGHYGVIGMRERAGRIGALLTLTTEPGQGTKIVVEVPVPV